MHAWTTACYVRCTNPHSICMSPPPLPSISGSAHANLLPVTTMTLKSCYIHSSQHIKWPVAIRAESYFSTVLFPESCMCDDIHLQDGSIYNRLTNMPFYCI